MSEKVEEAPEEQASLISLAPRSVAGGILMGLANLVPGISGGTMLLATGIYPRFIRAIAELTTLKFKKESIAVLVLVVLCAGLAILTLAGPVKTLVVEHRWIMYSVFIGLTLGGIPVVWQLVKPPTRSTWIGAVVGFIAMALLAVVQSAGGGGGHNEGIAMMFFAGVAGASAMILPGISGGYLLLVLGVYVPVLGAVDAFKNALKAFDLNAAIDPTLSVVLPVGIGVVIGVVAVSNLLKILLDRYQKPTLGALLGFLAGAVVGLWPFQHGVKPEVGHLFRGEVLTAEALEKLEPSKYPTELFTPTVLQVGGAILLILAGFVATALIARFGREKKAKM